MLFFVIVILVSFVNADQLLWGEDFEDLTFRDTFWNTRSNESQCEGAEGNGYGAVELTDYESRHGTYSLRYDSCYVSTDPLTGRFGCNNVRLFFGDLEGLSEPSGNKFPMQINISETNETFIRYWIRYEPDGDPVLAHMNERLLDVDMFPGFYGYTNFLADPDSSFGNPMTSRYYSYFTSTTYDNPLESTYVRDGEWHKMEYYVKYNDNGQTNGIIRGWIDGQLVLDWNGGIQYYLDGRPRIVKLNTFSNNFDFCTYSPLHIDDFEIWDGMPGIVVCSNGAINSLCECGGSARDYGYCLNGVWDTSPVVDCVYEPEVCDDRIDNDCDTLIDCEDPVCSYSASCNLECGSADIKITAGDNYILYFNGEYVGHDSIVGDVETYNVTLKTGNNAVAVNSFNNETGSSFIVEIDYCGNTIVSDNTWKTTGIKPFGWMNRSYDESSWSNALVIGGTVPGGIDPSADWIWTSESDPVAQAGYDIGWFRKDFNVNAVPSPACQLNFANWSHSEVDMGTQVDLRVEGNYCHGQQVNFGMFEYDNWAGDYTDVLSQLSNPPSSVTFDGDLANVTWVTEWVEDEGFLVDINPEYVFNASVAGDSILSENDLKVNYIISNCGYGSITVPCDCGGVEYNPGDGYCCGGVFNATGCGTSDAGLILHLPFDGDLTDISGYSRHASCGAGNCPTLVADKDGNANSAYSFSGIDQFATVAHESGLSGLDEITVAYWVNVGGWPVTSTLRNVIVKCNWASASGCEWRFRQEENAAGGNPGILWQPRTDGIGNLAVLAETDSPAGEWHHIAGTWSFATDRSVVFVDGVEVDNTSTTGSTLDSAAVPISIGSSSDNGGAGSIDDFYGSIDDVRIYNRTLSEVEIQAVMSGIVTGTYCGDGTLQMPNDAGTGGPLNDGYEVCDILDWGGVLDCIDLGFDGGVLDCNINCTFNTDQCISSCIDADSDGYNVTGGPFCGPVDCDDAPGSGEYTYPGNINGYCDCDLGDGYDQGTFENCSDTFDQDCNGVDLVCSDCVDGSIAERCLCGGVAYDPGAGYCCGDVFSGSPCPGLSEIIIDNTDLNTNSLGSWFGSTNYPGYYGSNYLYSDPPDTQGQWFEWYTTNLEPGIYNVYAWWVAVAGRPDDVSYNVTHSSGTEVISGIDQQVGGSDWYLLGTFDFGTDGSVRVISGSNGYEGTCADAINFTKITGCTEDTNCTYLTQDYCSGVQIMHDEGRCISTFCTPETTITQNCSTLDNDYCSGDNVVHDNYTCASASCVVDATIDVEYCNSFDGLYDTGITQWVDITQCTEKEQKEQEYRDYTCSGSGCDFTVSFTQWVDTGTTRNKDDGTTCNDGQFCTEIDQCLLGVCDGSVVDPSDGVGCTVDSCDETNDVILNTPSNALCDDSAYCNGVETCDALLDCQAGTSPDCADDYSCTDDSCNEGTDSCDNVENDANCGFGEVCDIIYFDPPIGCGNITDCTGANDGELCNNGIYCDGPDECASEICINVGPAVDPSDGVSCTMDSCDEPNNQTLNVPDDNLCLDGLWCNGGETCHVSLDCQAGIAELCDDSNSSTIDSCDEGGDIADDLGQCIFTPIVVDGGTYQDVVLSQGWNLVTMMINSSIDSSDLNSLFVMRYENNNWEMDITGTNPFDVDYLGVYYVYSLLGDTLQFNGTDLNSGYKYNLVNGTWNLFSVQSSDSFNTLYPEWSEVFGLYSISSISGSFIISEIADLNTPLSSGSYYWANLEAPELSPPGGEANQAGSPGVLDILIALLRPDDLVGNIIRIPN